MHHDIHLPEFRQAAFKEGCYLGLLGQVGLDRCRLTRGGFDFVDCLLSLVRRP